MVCPQSRHAGSKVAKKGLSKDTSGQEWQRYECRPLVGERHKFRLPIAAEPVSVVIDPPPRCPDPAHRGPGEHVIRNGWYGRRVRRQRYECSFTDDEGVVHTHWFVAELPRDHVGDQHLECRECQVMIGVHRGDQASSRRSSYPLTSVVDALADLAKGVSYAKVSTELWDRAELARQHLATHEHSTAKDEAATGSDETAGQGQGKSGSWGAKRGRDAWHLAGDLVEQYSQVLFIAAMEPVRTAELAQRAANDEVKAAGDLPDQPITFAVDEIPVYVRMGRAKSRVAWTLLTVAQVIYRHGKHAGDPIQRETRLRLARALPGPANSTGWFLVLDELGVAPDVLVSDWASSARNAAHAVWPQDKVRWVPSLYHLTSNLNDMLLEKPGYHRGKGKDREPVPELAEHVGIITRDWLVEVGATGWTAWWDQFEALARAAGASPNPVRNVRQVYEESVVAAVGYLADQPFLPASNASIEIKNRQLLKPLLRGRSQRYRNIARTNALLDLVVARDQGVFLDRGRVMRLIRDDNLAPGNHGWATPRRGFDDPQPPATNDSQPAQDETDAMFHTDPQPVAAPTPDDDTGLGGPSTNDASRPERYASLLDPGLVSALYASRLEQWAEAQS